MSDGERAADCCGPTRVPRRQPCRVTPAMRTRRREIAPYRMNVSHAISSTHVSRPAREVRLITPAALAPSDIVASSMVRAITITPPDCGDECHTRSRRRPLPVGSTMTLTWWVHRPNRWNRRNSARPTTMRAPSAGLGGSRSASRRCLRRFQLQRCPHVVHWPTSRSFPLPPSKADWPCHRRRAPRVDGIAFRSASQQHHVGSLRGRETAANGFRSSRCPLCHSS